MVDEARFRSMGFDLHYENMKMIGGGDIIVASMGGAGQALLGNILLELGLDYVNLATEKLLPDGSSVPMIDAHSTTRRHRLAATYHRDTAGPKTDYRADRRFMKTHLPAEEFADTRFDGVWLLVRDPRDALYSWHQFHLRFAEREWERVPESFEQFLQAPFFTRYEPVAGWTLFHENWLQRSQECSHAVVVRFEDLKHAPQQTMRGLLEGAAVPVSQDDLHRAIQRSSYTSMRSHEDVIAQHDDSRRDARIMRSGQVEEWRRWITPTLARYFQDERLLDVARRLGYTISG